MTPDPIHGASGSGTPASGASVPGVPASGSPASGAPTTGAPAPGSPASGAPASRSPASGTPTPGVPTTGVPRSAAPASGVPASGVPASSTPARDAGASTRPGENASPGTRLPPESRAARSLTDRSKAEDTLTDGPQAEPAPVDGPRVWPRVVGVLILLLGAGGVWIWQNPGFIPRSLSSLFQGPAEREADQPLTLEARVARLEQRLIPDDPAPLIQRLDALEKRPAQTPSQPAVDLRPILARLDALEARARDAAAAPRPSDQGGGPAAALSTAVQGEADVRALLARLDALERATGERAVDRGKIDALAARVEALAARDPTAELRGRLDGIEHQLSSLAATGAKAVETSDHALRLARLDAAGVALAGGRALGSIPNAPPALARFADAVPPTEAALRLSFGPAARTALKVSQPDTEDKPFLDRVLARLQDFRLITVREGDQVVIGNAAAATLARAQTLLDAGDLAGAVRTVDTLSGPPAEQMAAWRADAAALVAAREALASLAGTG
jgi:hypothetical protein